VQFNEVLVWRGLAATVSDAFVPSMLGERYSLKDIPAGVVDAMRDVRESRPAPGCRSKRVQGSAAVAVA